MANTLTNLIPEMQSALDTVSRELVGFIPAVTSDMTFERAAVGQTVRSPVAPASSASDITPAVTPPDDGDQTIGNKDMTITKARRIPIRWNGEQSRGLNNSGVSRSRLMMDQFMQAYRTLTNEVESDLATAAYQGASRAYGTAGTTPFATAGDFSDASFVKKIIVDNGGSEFDNQLVLNTTAGPTITGKQASANIAGTDSIQRQGIILPMSGLDIRQSAQTVSHATGGITGTVTVTGVEPVGETTINLTTAAASSVEYVAGDILSIAGDANKYVVTTAVTIGASTTGDVVIAAPGLLIATTATLAITEIASYAANTCFSRNAIVLATRAPALPEEGDMAEDRQIITDARSGLSFEVAMYKQYRQVQYEVSLAWGFKAVKNEHISLLLG